MMNVMRRGMALALLLLVSFSSAAESPRLFDISQLDAFQVQERDRSFYLPVSDG